MNVTTCGTVMGMFIGGLKESLHEPQKFMDDNKATKFSSSFDARRQVQRHVMLTFMKGGASMAWKLGLFMFLFSGSSTALTVATAKHKIYHYTAGGMITGFLFKIHLGPRGGAVGAILAGVLGTMYGAFTIATLALTGQDITDIYHTHERWTEHRRQKIKEQQERPVSKDDIEKLFKINEEERLELEARRRELEANVQEK